MIGKNIGEGTFGKVKAGTHNVTGEKVSAGLSDSKLIWRAKFGHLSSFKNEGDSIPNFIMFGQTFDTL